MLKTTKTLMYQPNFDEELDSETLKSKAELKKMSQSIRQKLDTMIKQQSNSTILKERCLPVIPKQYPGPVINGLDMGKNLPICTNDAHIKATNNGYSRNSMGGFFAH